MNYRKLREEMVREQLIPRGIEDKRVLAVFRKVTREVFVLAELKEDAYGDFPLSIGEGQTISQPYMVALMTQCLELKGDEKVLEIGTGCGYQTAILAELSKEIYSIERIRTLAKRAEKSLEKLHYTNVRVLVGDGTLGWEEFSPYDRILVTAATQEVPSPLMDQLEEKGIMVIPVGGIYSQELKVIRKQRGRAKMKTAERCIFVPLIGRYGWDEGVRNE